MGQALYRKYRSKSLDEVRGQSHITDMLRRAIAKGNIAHAYLLTGPRGVGKTSIARILAHEINHLPYTDESAHLDIIEIDAASHTSVEDIRDLRERAVIAPAQADKKVYIIDEVHMLSKSAFNALLKILEEPPAHVVFILATTDVEKLPATIISRVQRFNFRSITPEDAVAHLRTIATAENIAIDDGALGLIALHGKGSFRDSISLLDQLQNLSDGEITAELVENILGLAEETSLEHILAAYLDHDITTIVSTIDTLEARGTPATVLAEQLIRLIRPRITEQLTLIPLLDRLLDTSKSAWPHVKLLTALTLSLAPVSTHPNSKPSRSMPRPVKETPAVAPDQPKTPQKPAPAPVASEPSAPPKPPRETSAPPIGDEQPFPWADFLEHARQDSTGTYTILTKCGYSFTGTQLLIYAGKKFNKARLDKSISSLAAALQAVGVNDGTVEITESSAPPKDSKTAAILDIMGGGQEVSL